MDVPQGNHAFPHPSALALLPLLPEALILGVCMNYCPLDLNYLSVFVSDIFPDSCV